MTDSLRRALANHVLRQLGAPPLSNTGPQTDLTPFLTLLPGGSGASADIFDALSGVGASLPPADLEAVAKLRRAAYGARRLLSTPTALPDPASAFEAWSALIEAEARETPGSRREKGVTLATEFRLLSAIGHAAGGEAARLDDGFTLVSGDFPGVQRVIYTIASDGATKGVRGRSFFLQLLAECVVRRILAEYALPLTNALYIAGGRFLLLLPSGVDVSALRREMNARLLEWFEGDLSFILAASPMPKAALANARLLRRVMTALREEELRQKAQPFVELLDDHFFEQQGGGSEFFCAISRREPRPGRETDEAAAARADNQPWVSPEQLAFRLLAEDLSRKGKNAVVFSRKYAPRPGINPERDYAYLLHDITGWSARLYNEGHAAAEGETLVGLNHTEFDPRRTHGFRFLAAHTPQVKETDMAWLEKHPEDDEEGGTSRPGETIRTFALLATRGDEGNGFPRLGVLRMDVDNLGKVFEQRLQEPTLTRQMALSSALSAFFEAYLPLICREVEEAAERDNSLYLLYGGGDDLFIVGEWDLLPDLAQRIHDLFFAFSQGKLTISAGIDLAPKKFPFYVAAERAKAALDDHAKQHNPRDEKDPRKNAVSLFGQVYGWAEGDDWGALQALRARLHRVLNVYEAQEQRTVIRNVTRVYERWREDYARHGETYLKFGPFCWMAAYQFTRISDGIRKLAKDKKVTDAEQIGADVQAIQQAILENIRLGGAAARWVEFEIRTQTQNEEAEHASKQHR
ncbi:MAG: type III-A CRISPR-associated protein Cas10/Csm1 [Anaerolineae bacterium]|nr:type III-A CRISPR-associated protein Cas10/Csm1 [Anaerolineae bacterium]NUQ04767.1 type III-A CRISPR-associated protein Cas10/Csm1 [Anaerolineae bacterium]